LYRNHHNNHITIQSLIKGGLWVENGWILGGLWVIFANWQAVHRYIPLQIGKQCKYIYLYKLASNANLYSFSFFSIRSAFGKLPIRLLGDNP